MTSTIANVNSEWIDGDLVFTSAVTGGTIMTLDAANAQLVAESLALGTKAAFVADLGPYSGTAADTELNEIATALNSVKDAVVSAGLMDAS